MKYIAEYEVGNRHRVKIGILADSEDEASDLVEVAFKTGTLWDNTPEMPLLYDGLARDPDQALDVTIGQVSEWPAPDISVIQIRRQNHAFMACRSFLDAEALRAQNAAPELVRRMADRAVSLAQSATGVSSHEVAVNSTPRIVVGMEGGVVQGISSDTPVEVVVLEYGDGTSRDAENAVVEYLVDLDPSFVQTVFDEECA